MVLPTLANILQYSKAYRGGCLAQLLANHGIGMLRREQNSLLRSRLLVRLRNNQNACSSMVDPSKLQGC